MADSIPEELCSFGFTSNYFDEKKYPHKYYGD
jgi:hypothetical protein